jgi:hypothetical protein
MENKMDMFSKLINELNGKLPTTPTEESGSALPKEGDPEVVVNTRRIRNYELTMVSRDSDSKYAFYVDKKVVLHGEYGGAGSTGKDEVLDGEAVANALILLFGENE